MNILEEEEEEEESIEDSLPELDFENNIELFDEDDDENEIDY